MTLTPNTPLSAESVGLLPCPFCGGEAVVSFGLHNFCDAIVRCQSCDAEGGMFDIDDGNADESGRNEVSAIAAWNRRPALSPPAEGEVVNERADVRQALDLALAYLGQFEPADSRAVSDEYVAMLMAGTEHHNDEGRKIIRDALARIKANPLPPIVSEVTFSDPDTPAPVDWTVVGPKLVERLADDLEAEIKGRYGDDILSYPGIKRKFDADMEIVTEARAALAAAQPGAR